MTGLFLVFLPGAVQGLTSVILGQPLDTAKTRMQTSGPQADCTMYKTMCSMVRHEGVCSLYRGTGPPLLMMVAKRSLQYAVWDLIRGNKDSAKLTTVDSAPMCRESFAPSLSSSALQIRCLLMRVGQWLRESPFLSGACAGASGTLIGCPLHVIKLRTQYSTREMTRNAWTCAVEIFRAEGVRGYFHGFRYHLMKDTSFAGCYLGLYDITRQYLQNSCASFTNTTQSATGVRGVLPGGWTFAAGCMASMVTWVLLYPLDTIKTVVQARRLDGRAVFALLQTKPLISMYSGLSASLLRAGPVSGISMVAYERVKGCVDGWHRGKAG
uniref:Uncharacterized protein TCIL3000_11_13800 n=1 Tax=Trypanosoma congolense (strain IL3000) TaxID=1068625 RepID=G0V2K2_TRYCI|nr:unnamed protein product [Trypanosoma congolense IL3000]